MASPLPLPVPVVETAPAALAQHATAVLLLHPLISLQHVPDTQAGVKLAASALPELKVAVTPMLNSTTPTALMMLASGKSIASTGVNAMEVLLHALLMPTLLAPRRYGHGVETHGNTGPLAASVDAALKLLKLLSFFRKLLPSSDSFLSNNQYQTHF